VPRNDQKRPAASEHDRPLIEIENSSTRRVRDASRTVSS